MKLVVLCLILVFVSLLHGSNSLRALNIKLPEFVKSGDNVTLRCDYDLEWIPLYAVKWYMNNVEFFRYVPKESPPFKAFNSSFLSVDFSQSGPTQVTLVNVTRQSTGTYGCEVSADAPTFHTDYKSAHMTVAVLPTENPCMVVVLGDSDMGTKGIVDATCNASFSFPATDLTWFLNDEEIERDNPIVAMVDGMVEKNVEDGTERKYSRIVLTVDQTNFDYFGFMDVKCFANIGDVWNSTTTTRLQTRMPSNASPVFESTSSRPDDGKAVVLDQTRSESCSRIQFYTTYLQAIAMVVVFLRSS